VTSRKQSSRTAPKAVEPQVVEPQVVEPQVVEPKAVEPETSAEIVRFIPTTHTTGTHTPSGATFALTPQVGLKISRTDAEALVKSGYGHIQGD
jgi:hypothetical protein